MKQYERSELKVLQEGRFLRLCEISYQPVLGDLTSPSKPKVKGVGGRKWEMSQRTTRQVPLELYRRTPVPFAIDSVEICAFLRRSEETSLILVAQYRPPLDALVLEFPAGLIDPGENVRSAALRELKEETGYAATEEDITSVTDPLCYEPGLTDSCGEFVRILVDGDKKENHNPKQQLDDGEDIEVILLPIHSKKSDAEGDTPLQALEKLLKGKYDTQRRIIIDARLYMFLDGLSLTRAMRW
ncbi:NUDIX hydrolase [Trypanosoma grayi]|uniref:NUDIX hydrolase n=1 Tax=Trypanosoma grayi TaxID=71804 RepID=UPI0004F4BB34|nr:NUDIX hydrolase [Trypanosoma grayi]KEG11666.1 NUDIX hydrolase [Trypanosoma grayi]